MHINERGILLKQHSENAVGGTTHFLHTLHVIILVVLPCIVHHHGDITPPPTAKLVPVGYGIQKLQIICNVEDDKVGTDDLEEEIIKFEEHVS